MIDERRQKVIAHSYVYSIDFNRSAQLANLILRDRWPIQSFLGQKRRLFLIHAGIFSRPLSDTDTRVSLLAPATNNRMSLAVSHKCVIDGEISFRLCSDERTTIMRPLTGFFADCSQGSGNSRLDHSRLAEARRLPDQWPARLTTMVINLLGASRALD